MPWTPPMTQEQMERYTKSLPTEGDQSYNEIFRNKQKKAEDILENTTTWVTVSSLDPTYIAKVICALHEESDIVSSSFKLDSEDISSDNTVTFEIPTDRLSNFFSVVG